MAHIRGSIFPLLVLVTCLFGDDIDRARERERGGASQLSSSPTTAVTHGLTLLLLLLLCKP